MLISMLRAKLHHARVSNIDINYIGSITIDGDLLERSGILPYEKVLVVDVENAARFETYVLPGVAQSGTIQLNGASGRLVSIGDRLIVMAFAMIELEMAEGLNPRVVTLNEGNGIDRVEFLKPLPEV